MLTRQNLRVIKLAAVGCAMVVVTGACTKDEATLPPVDAADKVVFSGEKTEALPTTEPTTTTAAEEVTTTYRYGKIETTTTTAAAETTATTEAAASDAEAPSTTAAG